MEGINKVSLKEGDDALKLICDARHGSHYLYLSSFIFSSTSLDPFVSPLHCPHDIVSPFADVPRKSIKLHVTDVQSAPLDTSRLSFLFTSPDFYLLRRVANPIFVPFSFPCSTATATAFTPDDSPQISLSLRDGSSRLRHRLRSGVLFLLFLVRGAEATSNGSACSSRTRQTSFGTFTRAWVFKSLWTGSITATVTVTVTVAAE